MLNRFFRNWPKFHRFLIFIGVISIYTVLALFISIKYNIKAPLLFSIILLVVIYLSRSFWLPRGRPILPVRNASYAFASGVIGSFSFWEGYVEQVLIQLAHKYFGIIITKDESQPTPYALLVFALATIYIVNSKNSDNTGMGVHPNSANKDIPDRDFEERFSSVCEALEDSLRGIDIKNNWSPQHFINLEAEVEVISNGNRKKRILDLLSAIRSSEDRIFLVLGDPGSGKSVALRKLCIDLLKESKKTEKIPLYIDLKEWRNETKWSTESRPSVIQLKKFILSNIQQRDIVTSEFFTKYFDILYDTGRLYFVLDSFDEIPAVLDENENSDLINQLSEVMFLFLKGARSNKSQGILASRIFRKPTDLFQAKTTLEIRPLSEAKILTFFEKRLNNTQIVKKIFKTRQDLSIVLRNPFLATLLIEYLKNNNQMLPDNQFIMYSSFISNAINSNKDRFIEYEINEEDVIKHSKSIAREMFESNSLEIKVDYISKKLKDSYIHKVAEILKYIKVGKYNNSSENIFSFTHRRFMEYFYVLNLMDNKQMVDLESIPLDSQSRDALVLYCQIVEEQEAKRVANFCWSLISVAENFRSRDVLHCLRFLNDAYRGRKNCLESFQDNLASLIDQQITSDNEMLMVKLSLESVGLLKDEQIDMTITKAFEIGNYWTNDAAIRSCRHLPTISSDLEYKLYEYVSKLKFSDVVNRYFDLNFSFSLSDAFAKIKIILKLKLLDVLPNIVFACCITLVPLIITFFIDKNNDKFGGSFISLSVFLLFVTTSNLKFFVSFYSFKAFKSNLKSGFQIFFIIFIAAFLLLIVFICYFYLSKISPENFLTIKKIYHFIINYILGPIFGFAFIVAIFKTVYNYLSDAAKMYKANFNLIDSRKSIYSYYGSLSTDFFKKRFVKHLENEVTVVKGEWPNPKFLSMTQDINIIRIAKLDEKWRGLDK